MHSLTKPEACEWCVAHRVSLDDRQLPQPNFVESQGRDFKIPGDTGQRIALLSGLFRSLPNDQEILLWFTAWGVWPSSERAHMFERFRDSYGEHRWLSDAPAYVFSPAEREDLIQQIEAPRLLFRIHHHRSLDKPGNILIKAGYFAILHHWVSILFVNGSIIA